MKKQIVYILWDEQDGYRTSRVYIDNESADLALNEHYTEYWIKNGRAKVEEIEAVSYVRD